MSWLTAEKVFIQPDTDHWCRIPESDDLIATCRALNRTTDCVSMVKHLSIPKERYDDGCQTSWKFSNCRRYNNISTDFRELLVNNSVTIGCDHGWEYDTSQYISTVIHEFDLVCDRYYLNALMTSLHMAGYMCGNIVFGPLSDKIGRMKVFMIAIILFEVCTLIEALAPNLVVFAVFRFGAAIALHGGFLTSFVLMTEAVGPSKRTYVGVILFLFYSCGYMAFALIGYLIREWRYLLLVISLPGVLFLSYWWIIPESARWLLAVGDIRRAERILKKTARMNRKSIPDDVFPAREVEEDVKKPVDQNDNKSGCKRVRVGDIFRFKTTRKRCLIMFYAGYVYRLFH
ncbi:organic cation transporter protein-like isoform X2 [Ptychodera flava]|uniref:organic cation transporter protein-like isoform X2 n=1 Tax=Ptychodera flava TaxID=63121 RepID=UPI00396A7478